MEETYSFQTPYAANNPISFIDFMGLGPEDIYVDEDDDSTVRVESAETWNAIGGAEGARVQQPCKMQPCNRVRNRNDYTVYTRRNGIGGVSARAASWFKVDGWIKENGFWNTSYINRWKFKPALDATWIPLYDKVR